MIPSSAQEIKQYAQKLSFSKEFHLDLVDGIFVPKKSWPYEPLGEAIEVKTVLDSFTLEVDLMVADPVRAAQQWIKAGADMLVFHVETISLTEFEEFTQRCSVSVGISMHGDTTMEVFAEYLPFADYVQLMGIHQIGAQGQAFDEAVLEKIAIIKRLRPNVSITVDGSVNKDTIQKIAKAGADRFIAGSAVVLQTDPEAAHAELKALINV